MRIPKVKLVFDRKHQSSNTKEGAVDLRVCYDSRQKFLSTGVKVLPKNWDTKNECVKLRADAVSLNRALSQIKNDAITMLTDMVREGEVDLSRLGEIFKPKVFDMTFVEYVKSRIGKRNVSDHTKERYETFVSIFSTWNGVVNFSDVTEAKIREFDEWLHKRVVRGHLMEQSTIASYHKYFKIFINDAVIDGYVKNNPYQTKRIKIDKGEGGQIACLTENQVEEIEGLERLDLFLERVRDLFLFQCYTGLAYSDMQKFKLKDCLRDEEGRYIVKGKRTKTNTDYIFILSDKALKLVEKYKGRLPVISNQKYNQYLKIIGKMVGVDKLHSHMGRSTFASTCLNKGMNTDVLKHALGHTTTIETNRYATMQDKTVIRAFEDIQKKGGC